MFLRFILSILVAVLFLNAETLRVELKEFLEKYDSYKVVDARESALYDAGHLKGAISFPEMETYEHMTKDGKLMEPEKMQKTLQKAGLDTKDAIVIYGSDNFYDASRVFWALEVYGFKNVKLLDIGYDGWVKAKQPTTTEKPSIKPSSYVATLNNSHLATKLTMQIATKSPKYTIIDARKLKEYMGEVSSAKRFGHIPKSVHIPALYNLDNSDEVLKIKNAGQLKELYKDLDKDKKIVAYCAMGKAAATNYFALRELGYDVAIYDASWNEWGNDLELPITSPKK